MVLPNGEWINAQIAPGKNLWERINNWHSTNNTNINIVSTVSTNFVEASHLQHNIDYTWMEPEHKDDDAPLPTKREVEELEMLESLIATTQKRVEETKKRIIKSGPTTRSFAHQEEQAPKQSILAPRNIEKPCKQPASTGPAPQFRYHTPIKDSALIAKVVKQALDVEITLPIQDILSISPDVRQHIKDQIMTK